VQEIRWPGKRTVMKKNYKILCRRHKSAKYEFWIIFYIIRHIVDKLLDFEPVNERIYKSMVKLKYYN